MKLIQNTSLAVLFTLLAFTAFDYAFSLPVVYESYSTRACTSVENYPGVIFNRDSHYTCENLPTRYTHEWSR